MNKRLVICLDGTWNTPSQEQERSDGSKVFRPTNVLKVARGVTSRASDGMAQVVYYDTGVGAMAEYPGYTNGVLRWFDSKLGGAWGAGFEGNVDDAYRFLAHNFEDGDSVYLFGYSRGAAQAQALCKFIDWMHGVPVKGDIYYVPEFYRHYLESQGDPEAFIQLKNRIETQGSNQQALKPFRKLRIRVLGLWDTVMSLGPRLASDERTSSSEKYFLVSPLLPECVDVARHAIALDELRKDFRAEVWTGGNTANDMIQALFPGGHGNVGGGRIRDDLANGALNWIVDAASAEGLELDGKYLGFFRSNALGPLSNRRNLMYRLRQPLSFFNGRHGEREFAHFTESSNLTVATSTFERLAADSALVDTGNGRSESQPYEPPNLMRFLAANARFDMLLDMVTLNKVEQLRNK